MFPRRLEKITRPNLPKLTSKRPGAKHVMGGRASSDLLVLNEMFMSGVITCNASNATGKEQENILFIIFH
jgi:hypothetical protein